MELSKNTGNIEALTSWATSDEAVALLDRHDAKKSTIRDYKKKVQRFIEFVEQEGLHQNILVAYKKALVADLSLKTTASKNTYYNAARVFLSVISRQVGLDPNFFFPAKMLRGRTGHLKFGMEESDVENIEMVISLLPDPFKTARVKAMFCLMAYAGFRGIEVVTLQGCNIDEARKKALVYWKSGDDLQEKILPQLVLDALADYFEYLGGKPQGYVFKPLRGPQNEHLTTHGLRSIFRPILKASGVSSGKTLHGLRHYFVTDLLIEFGRDLLMVMKFTGHSSVSSIRSYDDRLGAREYEEQFHEHFNKKRRL